MNSLKSGARGKLDKTRKAENYKCHMSVASGSDITPCFNIHKPFTYIFSYVMLC